MCFDQKSSFGFALFGLLVSIWIYTRTENVKLAMGQTLGQTLASLTHVDGTQLLGRLLLPSVYLYRALTLLASLADANPNPNPIPNPIPIPNRRLLLLHHGAAAGLPVLCDSRQLPRRPAVRQHH